MIQISRKLFVVGMALLLAACGGEPETTTTTEVTKDISVEAQAFYESRPDLFTFAATEDLPSDLVWENGMGQPDLGSPQAKKGGSYYEVLEDFPPTLRAIGPDSNFSSRAWLSDFYRITWAVAHPDTGEYIPGIAESWAISPERKTVYIKINPAARWTDDEPITSDDALFAFFFYLSDYIQAPYYANFWSTEFTHITRYDDLTFSVAVPRLKPDMADKVLREAPVPMHFYNELGDDFPERYQWRYQPHAGPYSLAEDDVDMGVRLVLRRKQDWWARDNKYWRNLYNPDQINLTVVRDPAKRYESFRRGDSDLFRIATAEMWYDNLPEDDPDVANGYIHKSTFYNGGPRSNWGLWMNSTRHLLDNQDIRTGIQFATNWQLVIDNYFRGDMERLRTQTDGYLDFSNTGLTARSFDIEQATEHFARAGFTQRGPDGILVNEQGERLAFTLTTHYDRFADVFTILKEEAIKAGLEFRIEILDGASGFRKAQEKQHEIYFVSFNAPPNMYPDFWQYFHSDNAYDDAFLDDGSINSERKVKPQTNNLQGVANHELDQLVDAYDESEDRDEMIELSHQISQLHFDYASYSPGFVEPFYRTAYWRWVRWPEGFNHKNSTYPYELFVHWIDEDIKAETRAARRSGQELEPVIQVYDQFRNQ